MELTKELEQVCDANRNMRDLLLALSKDLAEASKYQCLIADMCDFVRQDKKLEGVHLQKEYNFSKANRLLPFLVYEESADSQKLVGAFATEDFAMDFVDGQQNTDTATYTIKAFASFVP